MPGNETRRLNMRKSVAIPLKIIGGTSAVFATVFTVYMLNLDMKFVAKFVDPYLQKHYDKIPRKQYV